MVCMGGYACAADRPRDVADVFSRIRPPGELETGGEAIRRGTFLCGQSARQRPAVRGPAGVRQCFCVDEASRFQALDRTWPGLSGAPMNTRTMT